MAAIDQRPGVRGACPGVHTPFDEADGPLLRVRLPGGGLTAGQLRVCAGIGAKTLEITSRANLQLRGLDPSRVRTAADALVEAGLALPDPDRDARRNVLASPTAGFDAREVLDTRPIVGALAALLADRAGTVSPKFGVLVDGGGAVSVRGRRLDVVLGAFRGLDGTARFEMRLDEALPAGEVPGPDAGPGPALVLGPADVLTLVGAAIDLCPPGGRAGDLVAASGRPEVQAQLVAAVPSASLSSLHPNNSGEVTTKTEGVGSPAAALGVHRSADGSRWCGAAPLLGRLALGVAATVADLADRYGSGEVRLTPWRGMILPGVAPHLVGDLVGRLEALGLSLDPSDPAHQVVACAGSTGCHSGLADTQADGARLVSALRALAPGNRPGTVHLSGCPKSCATRERTDVTLLAGPASGTYALFRKGPAGTVGSSLSPDAALAALLGGAE